MTARTTTGIGAQLNEMMSIINQYSLKSDTTRGSNTIQLSFMTLLWPLLPVLTPEPPTLVTELLQQQETCDVCGTTQGTPLTPCYKTSTNTWQLANTCDSGLRNRRPLDNDSAATPLEKLMLDVELKMDETLSSIESTIVNSLELSKKAREVENSQRSDMSDAEMLNILQSLVKEKAKREERVRTLEIKEEQLKESLKTAIEHAKSIQTREGIPDSPLDKQVLDQVAQAQEQLDSLSKKHADSEGLNLLVDDEILSNPENTEGN